MRKAILIFTLSMLAAMPGLETHGMQYREVLRPTGFKREMSGQMSGIKRFRAVIVRDAHSLNALWRQHGEGRPPVIDFKRFDVAAVFAGQKPTGGYRVRYDRTRRSGRAAIVEFVLDSPSPDMMVTQAITYPWALRVIPKLPAAASVVLKRDRSGLVD